MDCLRSLKLIVSLPYHFQGAQRSQRHPLDLNLTFKSTKSCYVTTCSVLPQTWRPLPPPPRPPAPPPGVTWHSSIAANILWPTRTFPVRFPQQMGFFFQKLCYENINEELETSCLEEIFRWTNHQLSEVLCYRSIAAKRKEAHKESKEFVDLASIINGYYSLT